MLGTSTVFTPKAEMLLGGVSGMNCGQLCLKRRQHANNTALDPFRHVAR